MRAFFDTLYERIFFRDMIITAGSVAIVVGQIMMVSLIFLNGTVLYGSGNGFLYLHYKIFMGVDYFARWEYIFLLPFSGIVCAGINYILARALFYSYRTIAQILMTCAAIFQYLLLFAVYLLIQINIF